MQESDIHQDKPGKKSADKKQASGDQFRTTRAGRRRLGPVVVVPVIAMVHRLVMRDVNDGGVLIDRRGRMRRFPMGLAMMLHANPARVARVRSEYGDQPGHDGAQQRQEYDRLNHVGVSPSSN